MGFEASKTNRAREPDFLRTYSSGCVLDIACGPDPIRPTAIPFDVEHGDANDILNHLQEEAFDCVHSSHCLEHMRDVRHALGQWWRLVKPGGYMVLVVPDEDLYEQGHWPSLFNSDHKVTFRLDKTSSWSPVSYDLRRLVEELPACKIIDIRIQDHGYDHALLRLGPNGLSRRRQFWQRVLVWLQRRRQGVLHRLGIDAPSVAAACERLERRLGKPVAQTDGDFLAQIQAVLRKRHAN